MTAMKREEESLHEFTFFQAQTQPIELARPSSTYFKGMQKKKC